MSGIKDNDNINDLRKRLYDRKSDNFQTGRHDLTKPSFDVARGWGEIKPKNNLNNQNNPNNETIFSAGKDNTFPSFPEPNPVNPLNQSVPPNSPNVREMENVSHEPNFDFEAVKNSQLEDKSEEAPIKKKRSYRAIILLASLLIFIVAALASSIYLFFGANQISANNINIAMSAPFAIGGGDVLPIQLSVTNQNSVAIESAVIILNYPAGTKSADEQGKDLFEERLPVNEVKAGEVINIPTSVILFGEENEDKEIRAKIEYRVVNSNGTFFKEADPITVKINSSPLALSVASVQRVSSGQEMDVTLTLRSNSANPMRRVLVSATFPNSFSFIRSEPVPSYGQNEWLFDEILPNETYTIKMRGLVSGVTGEKAEMQFRAGNPRADNQYVMGSALSQTKTEYTIEQAFIETVVVINGSRNNPVILNPGQDTTVVVAVKNTLSEPVYDMRVEITPKGNAFSDRGLNIRSGFYSSLNQTINWEISGMPSLEQVNSGQSRNFKFTVKKPDTNLSNAEFDVSVKVFARRVSESRASEEMIGTAIGTVRYSSVINLAREVAFKNNPFSDRGPVPPVANQSTSYTLTLEARAGVNEVTGGLLTTSLPQHVTWLNKTQGEGTVEFNPVSKQLRWDVGSISARGSKQIQFQVSLLPSVTHIGRTLTLLEPQDFRAVDSFTGANLQVRGERMTSELSGELGFAEGNGRVVAE